MLELTRTFALQSLNRSTGIVYRVFGYCKLSALNGTFFVATLNFTLKSQGGTYRCVE